MDLGETTADTTVREVEEETGIAFIAEAVRGEPRTSDESSEVEWIDPTRPTRTKCTRRCDRESIDSVKPPPNPTLASRGCGNKAGNRQLLDV